MNEADTTDDPKKTLDAGEPASAESPITEGDSTEAAADDTGAEAAAVDESASEEKTTAAPPPPPPAPVDQNKPAQEPAQDPDEGGKMDWYILKVAFNREDSIADALRKRLKMEGMAEFFGDIVVPTEDVATFTRSGQRRVSKRKLLPGYIMVNMLINDDTWFLVRETNGISDFTGAAGKPMPMEPSDVERFITRPCEEEEEAPIKIGIPFNIGDRVRVKEGNFENQEGDVDAVDEANGRITVIINIFGRSVPMELDHWQVEPL